MRKLFLFLALTAFLCSCSKDGASDIKLIGGTSKDQTVYADETVKSDGIQFNAVSDWYATVTDGTRAEGGSEVDWLSLSQYSGTAGDYSLSMSIKPNTTGSDRCATIRIVCGATTITIIVEQRSTTASGESMTVYPTDNQIWYTSSDALPISPNKRNEDFDAFGANIVSNTYANGKGIIVFDAPVTKIRYNAFGNYNSSSYDASKLTSIIIPNSVTSIGNHAFEGCSGLKSVTIPDSVTSIGERTFADCSSLVSVTIPENVTSIIGWTFSGCSSLTSVTIPDSVTSIYPCAFYGCSSLKSVTIPNGVTYIGISAFCGCSSLASVYCKPITPPAGDNLMFSDNAPERKIYVPKVSVSTYRTKSFWSSYSSYIFGYDF